MSVAESLFVQRSSIPINPKAAPSILHSAKVAATIPLSEQAALSLNSLTLLATVDPRLPTFASDLVLLNPVSRETLDEDAQLRVSSACVDVVSRLAPIFPIRHAQRVYEWLINGLHAGLLGSNAEVDALLLSALPFHESSLFPSFVAGVVLPRPRTRWKWLLPVAQTKKSPSLAFMIKYCPLNVHRRAIEWALKLASAGIPISHATAFLVNVTARWISDTTQANRRFVILLCMKSIATALTFSNDNTSHLLCALLIISTGGVVAGVEADVASAIALAATVLISQDTDSVSHTAVGCLYMVINQFGISCLPSDSALSLIRKRKSNALIHVGKLTNVGTRFYFDILIHALGSNIPSVDAMTIFTDAFMANKADMKNDFVSKLVTRVLDLFSSSPKNRKGTNEKVDEVDKDGLRCALENFLTPIAHGHFAEAVDIGLRNHFDNRGKIKSGRYDIVDKALASVLSGTSHQVIKTKSGDESQTDSVTLLSALTHPEHSVRRHALQWIMSSPNQDNQQLTEALKSKLLIVLDAEINSKVILSVCDCLLKFSEIYDSEVLLRKTSPKLLDLLAKPHRSNRKRAELSQSAQAKLLSFSTLAAKKGNYDVLSLLIGIVLHDMFIEESTEIKRVQDLVLECLNNCENFDVLDKNRLKASFQATVCLFAYDPSFEHLRFLKEVSSWNPSWGFSVISLWCQAFNNKESVGNASRVFEAIISALQEEYVVGNDKQHLENMKLICEVFLRVLPDSDRDKCALMIWRVNVLKAPNLMLKDVMLSIFSALGVERATNVMGRAFNKFETEALRAASFQWYINIASFDTSEKSRNIAILSLIIAWFGDSKLIRDEAEKFMKVYLSEKSSRSNKNFKNISRLLLSRPAEHRVLLSHPSEHQKGFVSQNPSEVISSELNEHIIVPSFQKNNFPFSIPMSSINAYNLDFLVSYLLESIDITMGFSRLVALLRAIHGYEPEGNYSAKWSNTLWTLLQKLLEVSSDRFDLYYEVLARTISLLLTTTISSLTPKEILSLLDTIIFRLEKGLYTHSVDHRSEVVFLAAGALLFSMINRTIGEVFHLQAKYMKILLAFSARSSIVGTSSRRILDSTLGDFFPLLDLKGSLAHMNVSELKSLKTHGNSDEDGLPAESSVSEFDVVVNEVVGVLETSCRWCKRQPQGSPQTILSVKFLKDSLWKFLVDVTDELKRRKGALDEDCEFILRLSLDTLRELYVLNGKVPSEDVIMFDVVIKLLIYPEECSKTKETISVRAVRKLAMHLVEVLAPLCGEKLNSVAAPIIETLLIGNVSSKICESIRTLVLCLIKGGEKFEKISNWLLKASFNSSRSPSELSSLRKIIASCCRYTSSVNTAIMICIDDMTKLLRTFLSLEEVGRQCALFVQDAELSVMDDLGIISRSTGEVRSYFASAYLLNSYFVTKFFSLMNKKDNSEGMKVMVEYSDMLKSLAQRPSASDGEKAVIAALSILPLPGLAVCLDRACLATDSSYETVLMSFASLLEDSYSPISCDWSLESVLTEKDEKSVQAMEASFLDRAIHAFSNMLTVTKTNKQFSTGLVQPALRASEMLLKRFGAGDRAKSLKLVTTIVELVEEILVRIRQPSECAEEERMLLSIGLRCLSSSIPMLENHSFAIVPRALNASILVIEIAFGEDDSGRIKSLSKWMERAISVTEAAILVCASILECVPMLFGEKDLIRLICLVLKNESQVLGDILGVAVQKLPCSTVAISTATATDQLQEMDASAEGVGMMLMCLQNGLRSMKKSQVKLQANSFVSVCFHCLEFSRDKFEEELLGDGNGKKIVVRNSKNWISRNFGYVYGKCADVFTSLALRLPESEFKKSFDNFAKWCEGESLFKKAVTVCHKYDVQIQKTLLRAVPFYETVVRLFGKLGPIMIPYIMQHLDSVLSMLCTKKWSGMDSTVGTASKKRSLQRLETDEERSICLVLANLQEVLRNLCLESITLMLRQSSSTAFLTSEIVAKIQDSLLTCFDEFREQNDRVTSALCALSVRISSMRDLDESKENSRELLNSLSRQLLLRTRENVASFREGALATSKAMAEAVGDEYLVTLPETMPILAEVIDDEDMGVRKSALAFASSLGSMAGESIIDQLK